MNEDEGACSPELLTAKAHAWAGRGRTLGDASSHGGQRRNLSERRREWAQLEGGHVNAAHIAPLDAEGVKELERAGESRAENVLTGEQEMREREVTIVSMNDGVKIIYVYGDPTPTPPMDASSVARRPRGGGPPRRQMLHGRGKNEFQLRLQGNVMAKAISV